ncbi:uncharacterized protein J8A68_003959 [[Candida] subhashii]|uniref:Uncharacterized protein n=1 Tax=[Candida] subhashii TaxID=561895 RepID=A0A8J5QKB5_9ASCO|nr:uncharacterized protein J8A68_003959 [[Candida] subhashii]KAG7662516.1 hypothetical protein J8A68_003959 [[Candida] subhashii]
MTAFKKKISNYIDSKQEISEGYLALRQQLELEEEEEDRESLINAFDILLRVDELLYDYHVKKSYLELSKLEYFIQDETFLKELENISKSLERMIPLPELIGAVPKLAVFRRELFENAREAAKIIHQYEQNNPGVPKFLTIQDIKELNRKGPWSKPPQVGKKPHPSTKRNLPKSEPTTKRTPAPPTPENSKPVTENNRISKPSLLQKGYPSIIHKKRGSVSQPKNNIIIDEPEFQFTKHPTLTPFEQGGWSRHHVRIIFDAANTRQHTSTRCDYIRDQFLKQLNVNITVKMATYLLEHYGLKYTKPRGDFEKYQQSFDDIYLGVKDKSHAIRADYIVSQFMTKLNVHVPKAAAECGAKLRDLFMKEYGTPTEPAANVEGLKHKPNYQI